MKCDTCNKEIEGTPVYDLAYSRFCSETCKFNFHKTSPLPDKK